MITTDSTIVRAFTKRRPSKPPPLVSSPPAPPTTKEAFQRRQAALRQMGLIPPLTLSQQEAELDRFIPPSNSVYVQDSEADRIKKQWVANNAPDDRLATFKFGGLTDPAMLPLPPSPLPASIAEDWPTETTEFVDTTATESTDLVAPTEPTSDLSVASPGPLNDTPPTTTPINVVNVDIILEDQQSLFVNSPTEQGTHLQPTNSPITTDFCPPESPHSPVHLQPPRSGSPFALSTIPFRSRSPSLAGSDSKSTRSRSKSRTRARSPLRFFARKEEDESLPPLPLSPSPSDLASPLPPPPPPLTSDEVNEREEITTSTLLTSSPTPTPTSPRIRTQDPESPPQPQRKKTVFARFKRSNTVLPASTAPKEKDSCPQPPSRSKSLFTSVRKTVFGTGANTNASAPSEPNSATTHPSKKANEDTLPVLPSLPSSLPSLPSWRTTSSNSNPPSSELALSTATLTHNSQADSATLTPEGPTPDAELKDHAPVGVEVKVEDDGPLSSNPFGSFAEVDQPQSPEMGKVEFPPSRTSLSSSKSESDRSFEREREKPPSVSGRTQPRTGKGIGISLILNRERKPSTPSLSPASPISSLSSPTSPTWSTSSVKIRGKLGRKGTIGTEGLLSVLGGVSGLLGGGGGCGIEGINEEVMPERQALQPTIHNEASIMLNMSHIEDEEMRRVTEVAFM